ncbi:MAG: hypothetical protein H6839_00265 [Planctomycetes bacterium]|nr:hypothetical protein [Planctomycetota bacterium]
MRTVFLLCLLLGCSALAALEPRDEGLLQTYLDGKALLPGAIPVGYEHRFEVGDLQEAEVLDRGTYRTVRLHIVAKLGDEFVCEIHNGRGLVFAGLMNNNGEFSKAWVGRAGAKPAEVRCARHVHMQRLMHDAVRMPWPFELYNVPATSFSENETFKLGSTELTVQGAEFDYAGVHYQLRRGHGAENWFGSDWQWMAEDVVLFRVKRREKLASPEPLLDWSEVTSGVPKPVAAPAWKPPLEGWTVRKRDDGSTLVFSFDSGGEFLFLDDELRPVSGVDRIGPYGRRVVDAYSPGPFVVPAGLTLQLQAPNSDDWAQLDFLFAQSARLPVSMLVLFGAPAGDRGLRALKDFGGLQSLDVYPQGAELTESGMKAIAGLKKLRELSFTFVEADRGLDLMAPLKAMTSVRRLALHSPLMKEIPAPLKGWSQLESLELTGADVSGIKAFTGLTEVQLLHCTISRGAAEEVAGLPRLRSLEIHTTDFPSALVRKLSMLERLSLTTDSPEDASFIIESAAKLKTLKSLELTVDRLAGEDLLALTRSSVERLVIYGGLEKSEDVAALAKLTALKELQLIKVAGADVIGLQALSALRTLKRLTLAEPVLQRSRSASAELAELSRFDFLEELHLRDCALAKLGPIGLKKFSNLKALTLGKLNLTQEAVDELPSCPGLELLSLDGSLLPQGSVLSLEGLKTLKLVSLKGCLSVSADEVRALAQAMPACTVVR